MGKRLERVNGKWIDRNDNSMEFKGHVMKDLDKGDQIMIDNGKGPQLSVVEGRETLDNGMSVIRVVTVNG
jgi:hypothetical protein